MGELSIQRSVGFVDNFKYLSRLWIVLCAFAFAQVSHADQFTYNGTVDAGEGSLLILVPLNSTLSGPIDLTTNPGGSSTDVSILTLAKLLMNNEAGNSLFCFNLNSTCGASDGTEVPITAITSLNLSFALNGCPYTGTIELLAFSPTFNLDIPVTLNITDGTFLAASAGLGMVSGTGTFSCTGVPVVSSSPDPANDIDFGTGIIGQVPAIASTDVTVTSFGGGQLDIQGISLTGATDFSITNNTCTNAMLAPNATCTITIGFTPTTIGSPTGTLSIATNAVASGTEGGGGVQLNYNLTATVTDSPGEISVTQNFMFADTEVGMTDSVDVTVTNTGAGSLDITGNVATANPLAVPFSITADTCSMMTVPPMGTCTITVQFAPGSVATFMDSFDIPSDDPMTPVTTIDVQGDGIAAPEPILGAAPNPLNLPMAMISESSTGDLTISNTGNADLDVTGLSGLTGAFSVMAETCVANLIPPAGSCTVTVEFTPAAVGMQTGMLSIASNDAASPEVVTVEGTAQLIADIDANPAALTFTPLLIGQTDSQSVTISNLGNTDLTLNGSSIVPAGNYTRVDNCPATLAMGATCTIDVTFAPMAAGTLDAVLNVASDDPDENPLAINLSGTGIQPVPEIDVTPTSLDLGAIVVGNSSNGMVTVSNTGTANLNISSLTIDAPFSQMSNCVGALAPAATCTITVTYTPPTDVAHMGNLTIVSDDADEGMFMVALSGSGVLAPTPNIATNPTAATGVDFGTVLIGDNAMQTITVNSNGSADLSVTAVTLAGVDAVEFAHTDNCVGTVAMGTTCTIDVTFTPALPEGAKAASVMISSDDPDTAVVTIPLAGMSEAPVADASLSTTAVMFASVEVGQTSQSSITVTNTGNGDLVVSAVGGTDPIDPPFSILSETCTAAPIAPMATCLIDLTFMPTVAGDFNDTFTFESNGATASIPVSLSGTATDVATPMIMLDTMALDFGNVILGAPQTLAVTVTNNGNADLTVSAANVAPMGDFTAVNNCAVVIPAATCTVDVTYSPSAAGAANATLTIASDDPMTPASVVSLTAVGVMPEPEITVAPLMADLGSAVVGATVTADVMVSNSGQADLVISGVVIGGTNAGEFSQTNTCATVAAAGNCTITVTYAPTVAGNAVATLTITSNDADEGSVDVALAAMATPMPMPMIAAPATVDVGSVMVGMSGNAAVVIENQGTADLTISGIQLGGTDAALFTQTNNCAVVAAMASCTVDVTFTPTAAGAATATLTINSDDPVNPMLVTTLNATASAGMAMLNVSSVDFQNVTISETASSTVTVSNTGTATLTIVGVVVENVVGGTYTVTNGCSVLGISQTCDITIDYTAPSSPMDSSAVLKITTDDPANAEILLNLIAKAVPLEEVIVRVTSSGGTGSAGLLDLAALIALFGIARRRAVATIVMAAASLFAVSTFADNDASSIPLQGYWYGGAGGGSSSGQADTAAVIGGIEAAGVTVTSLSLDDSDNGWKAFIGYQATENIALEVGYADLGTAGIDLQLGATTIDQLPLISRAVSGNTSLLGGGYTGSVVVRKKFKENFAVLARVGLLSWEVESIIGGSTSTEQIRINELESGTDFLFGVGAEYWFSEVPVGIRAEWERYSFGDENAEMLSVSGQFRF